ncbi:MAG: SGNH/GDSL hydrolase family protein [Clostridia bacterium]|nr:SGNH/GDSL hydrolase family protein [Clostridia bacterium]
MRILFQGDSITDAGRFEDEKGMGWGYPLYASELIKNRHPEIEFEFINRGISGHKVSDLAARWQQDCIDLQPDVVSILIGVNDTWHHAENRNWIPNEEFEATYRGLLTDIKEKTNAKIIILEQFLIPVEDKEFFRIDLDPKIQITRKLAREFADAFIPTDGLLAAHYVGVEPTLWAADGVHPTEAGARLIGDFYADAFDKILPLIRK